MGLQSLKSPCFWFFSLSFFSMFPFFNCELLYGSVLSPLVFICNIISHPHSALILTQIWLPDADFQSRSLCLGSVLNFSWPNVYFHFDNLLLQIQHTSKTEFIIFPLKLSIYHFSLISKPETSELLWLFPSHSQQVFLFVSKSCLNWSLSGLGQLYHIWTLRVAPSLAFASSPYLSTSNIYYHWINISSFLLRPYHDLAQKPLIAIQQSNE